MFDLLTEYYYQSYYHLNNISIYSRNLFFYLLNTEKSKLQKKQGLLYKYLNNNIKDVIKTIPKEYYKKNKIRKYKEYKI